MVEIDRRKAALIAELEISRGEIRSAVRACEESLNVVSLVRKNVRHNLSLWLPGAALGGWALSKLLCMRLSHPRPAAREREASSGKSGIAALLLGVGKIALDLARPSLLEAASDWVARTSFNFSSRQGTQPARPTEPQDPARNGTASSRAQSRG